MTLLINKCSALSVLHSINTSLNTYLNKLSKNDNLLTDEIIDLKELTENLELNLLIILIQSKHQIPRHYILDSLAKAFEFSSYRHLKDFLEQRGSNIFLQYA
jgi:hypothetical protein